MLEKKEEKKLWNVPGKIREITTDRSEKQKLQSQPQSPKSVVCKSTSTSTFNSQKSLRKFSRIIKSTSTQLLS
jgi:hypothetical protein